MTSKEIARELGVSPFTIDQRLDAARRKLGAPTRREAARKFMLIERTNTYESSIYEPISIDKTSDSETLSEPAFNGSPPIPEKVGNRGFVDSPDETEHLKPKNIRVVPLIGGQRHNLSNTEVSKTILMIAFLSMTCLSALVMILLGIMKILEQSSG